MTDTTLCPVCGHGQLSSRQVTEEMSYKGVSRAVVTLSNVCNFCGTEQAGPNELKHNKREIMRVKKEIDGLLTGRQVRLLRESLGITQKEASQIFGGGPVAFSKYEKDDVIQSEAMDKLLRLATFIPAAFNKLVELSQSNVKTLHK